MFQSHQIRAAWLVCLRRRLHFKKKSVKVQMCVANIGTQIKMGNDCF